MTFLRIVIPLYAFVEHYLCPTTGIHFSGSCSGQAKFRTATDRHGLVFAPSMRSARYLLKSVLPQSNIDQLQPAVGGLPRLADDVTLVCRIARQALHHEVAARLLETRERAGAAMRIQGTPVGTSAVEDHAGHYHLAP